MAEDLGELEKQWSDQAEEWNRWIGDHGDSNRRESSDICLWKSIGSVDDQVVLDAGCGNGYLTIKFALETRAKHIFAVDLSSTMVDIAQKNVQRRVERDTDRQRIDVRQDSVTELKTIDDLPSIWSFRTMADGHATFGFGHWSNVSSPPLTTRNESTGPFRRSNVFSNHQVVWSLSFFIRVSMLCRKKMVRIASSLGPVRISMKHRTNKNGRSSRWTCIIVRCPFTFKRFIVMVWLWSISMNRDSTVQFIDTISPVLFCFHLRKKE